MAVFEQFPQCTSFISDMAMISFYKSHICPLDVFEIYSVNLSQISIQFDAVNLASMKRIRMLGSNFA